MTPSKRTARFVYVAFLFVFFFLSVVRMQSRILDLGEHHTILHPTFTRQCTAFASSFVRLQRGAYQAKKLSLQLCSVGGLRVSHSLGRSHENGPIPLYTFGINSGCGVAQWPWVCNSMSIVHVRVCGI